MKSIESTQNAQNHAFIILLQQMGNLQAYYYEFIEQISKFIIQKLKIHFKTSLKNSRIRK